MNITKQIFLFLLTVLLSIAPGKLNAQKIKVPVGVQFELLPKILLFDKNTAQNQTKKIGVVFNSSLKNSNKIRTELENFINSEETSLGNIKFIFLDLNSINDLYKEAEFNKLDAVYLSPTRFFDVKKFSNYCRQQHIITFTGVEEYFSEGISIYFDMINQKSKITINITNARLEGADFSSHLLKLANVIN